MSLPQAHRLLLQPDWLLFDCSYLSRIVKEPRSARSQRRRLALRRGRRVPFWVRQQRQRRGVIRLSIESLGYKTLPLRQKRARVSLGLGFVESADSIDKRSADRTVCTDRRADDCTSTHRCDATGADGHAWRWGPSASARRFAAFARGRSPPPRALQLPCGWPCTVGTADGPLAGLFGPHCAQTARRRKGQFRCIRAGGLARRGDSTGCKPAAREPWGSLGNGAQARRADCRRQTGTMRSGREKGTPLRAKSRANP